MYFKFYKGIGMFALMALIGTAILSPVTSFAARGRYVSNQTILYQMLQSMSTVKSYNFEGKYSVKLPKSEDDFFQGNKFDILFFGSENRGIDTAQNKTQFSLSLSDGRGVDTYPHIDTVSEGTDVYVKVSNLSWLANMLFTLDNEFVREESVSSSSSVTGTMDILEKYGLNIIDNKWVKVSGDSLKNFYSQLGLPADELLNNVEMSKKFSQEQLEDIVKSARKHNVLLLSRLKDETIEQKEMYHLKVMFNRAHLVPFLKDVSNILKEPITADEAKELSKEVKKWQLPTFEVWVGQDDYLLHKLSMNLKIKDAFIKNAPPAEHLLAITFNGYGITPFIVIPSEYRPIEEVIGELVKKWGLGDLFSLGVSTTVSQLY